ncbi:MAG: carboxy terminal-processing peptidase [Verrucomicrobiota bacterium]|jgi:carboxyl-terminal processing protease
MSIAMRQSKITTPWVIAPVTLLCLFIVAGCTTVKKAPPSAQGVPTPGPNDARISYVTARLLEEYHYSQHPLDEEMSKKFFDGYLEALDPQHLYFLQSDIADFARYRTNLDTLTIDYHGASDLTPAREIFQRFLERLKQRVAYVDPLLKQDEFQFYTRDPILLDRRKAPYPKDLAEAQNLWRQRLLYDYLQEKLSREVSPTNGNVIVSLPKSTSVEMAEKLTRHYHWILRMFTNWDSSDVLQVYLNALAHAYDPHSDYLNTSHAQDFSIDMSLSLFGIGAQLHSEDGYCTIVSLIPGGPAAKSKQLKENDRIIAVAQGKRPPVDVVDMEISKAVQLIRGPKGTEVQLTIIPADDSSSRRVVSLIRDEIKLEDQEAKALLIESPDGRGGTNRLGVIDLPSFYATINLAGNAGHSTPKSTTADASKLIKKLEREKVAGIIVDLRYNGGGSLEEAVHFTGLFITNGPVVLARLPDGRVVVDEDNDSSELYGGPLIVLVNRFSASASEIVAGALQDYGRALIVGDTSTYGKGTVQNLNPLRPFIWSANESITNDPGTVKITIRKFYRVSGASTQLKGVTPDIVLPDASSYSTSIGENSLENALPWDTIHSADYEPVNLVKPYLAKLSLLSNARVTTNQDFIYIRQDIGEFSKLQADKTASLNERERLKELEEDNARQKARAQERAARRAPDKKTYEITPENADQPGLATETNAIDHAKLSEGQLDEAARLDETERILEDYISLLSSNQPLIAN